MKIMFRALNSENYKRAQVHRILVSAAFDFLGKVNEIINIIIREVV